MKKNKALKLLKIGGKFVKQYGPQLMAAAGTACFIASIIFAVKEAPVAKEILDDKLEDDPEMNIFEKTATMASNMPKTVIAGTAGTALTAASWVGILGKVAVATGTAAAAKEEVKDFVEASKEVVGEDKTQDIISRKESLSKRRPEKGEYTEDRYDIPHPFILPNASVVWMTWNEYDERQAKNVDELVGNRQLSMNQYLRNLGVKHPCRFHLGWEIPECGMTTDKLIEWARDILALRETRIVYASDLYGFELEFKEPDEILYDDSMF